MGCGFWRSARTADDQVLAAALAAQTNLILSGDAYLLHLKSFQGIEIITALQAAT